MHIYVCLYKFSGIYVRMYINCISIQMSQKIFRGIQEENFDKEEIAKFSSLIKFVHTYLHVFVQLCIF